MRESAGDSKDILEQESEVYNEEEDEDFDPTKGTAVQSDGGSDDEFEDEIGQDQASEADYSRIENDQGGLVKTRRARQIEEEEAHRNKYEALAHSVVSNEVGSLWDELKQEGDQRLKTSSSIMSNDKKSDILHDQTLEGEQMLIQRTYKFAGEVITEKKWVLKSSAEAQEYLNSLKFKKSQGDGKPSSQQQSSLNTYSSNLKLRRPLKRPPILEQIITGALKPKLTTLEKSKLDWATYVDKEGINEELTLHNKDGYLARQDFLDRVETFKGQKYKELRQKQISQQQKSEL